MATTTKKRTGVRAKLATYRRKRDFRKTAEPEGKATKASKALHFVIQKHSASHLHFDFRLELDGVMKSWAVPKGPSIDPAVKRLAMEVEDHPIEYNKFEGTIPKGQYGGGTVMLWDRGTYTDDPVSDDPAAALGSGYAKGEIKFMLDGERLKGSWVLVRTRRGEDKPQWLLIKHKDKYSKTGGDIVGKAVTSVTTGRTMDEIAEGKRKGKRVWESNRDASAKASKASQKASAKAVAVEKLEPMYASVGSDIPDEEGWTFEPKYDGIRVLAFVTPDATSLITRNGNDKSSQFPEIVGALEKLAKQAKRPFVIDGEIVAMTGDSPLRFQDLQSRVHSKNTSHIAGSAKSSPVALFAFDLLMDGDDVLVNEEWHERRTRLEKLLRRRATAALRVADSIPDDGAAMLAKAHADGWEGIMAKRIDSRYQPGVRSKEWLKLKIEHRQEFVIGGYTEPRNSREHIGALLLGVFDRGKFTYVGHTGGGFTRAGLATMGARLKKLERKTSPFVEQPKTNEKAHWVTPEVVVEVKFNEWTSGGKLRQPIYLGVRDDKDARDVTRESASVQKKKAKRTVSRAN